MNAQEQSHGEDNSYQYWAFISYSNKDKKWARWLHKGIESYGIPAQFVSHTTPVGEPAPKRFQPVFHDRAELPASSSLSYAIEQALRQSRYLIVICSPQAAVSKWVNKEIETFRALRQDGRVFAIVVEGEPNQGGPQECFPPALRLDEPVAPDARATVDGKANAMLKILAGMLGVGFDALKQRDTRRRLRKLQVALAISCLGTGALTGISIYANVQRLKGEVARNHAERQKERAEERSRRAEAGRLVAEANSILQDRPQQALLLLGEALNIFLARGDVPLAFVEQALWDALRDVGGISLGFPGQALSCMVFSPNGRWLAAGDWDCNVRLWDLEANDVLASAGILRGHPQGLTALTVSPDSRWLASADQGGNLILWDLNAPKPGVQGRLPAAHQSWINAMAFGPDGGWLATAGDDGSARLWELNEGQIRPRPVVLTGHVGPITALKTTADGARLFTAGDDGKVRLWVLGKPGAANTTGKDLAVFSQGVSALEISPGGRWLVCASKDGTARVWNLADVEHGDTGKLLNQFDSAINAVAISPDGHWLATGGFDGIVRLWDLAANDVPGTQLRLLGHDRGITTSALLAVPSSKSPSGFHQMLISGEMKQRFEGEAKWRRKSDSPSARIQSSGALVPKAPGGLRVVGDGFVEVSAGGVTCVAMTADGRWLFAGGSDAVINRWDLKAADIPASRFPLRGHEAWISSLVFGLNEKYLATTSWDGTARLWCPPKGPDTGIVGPHLLLLRELGNHMPGARKFMPSSGDGSKASPFDLHKGLLAAAREFCGRNLTTTEWERFFPGQPYRRTFNNLPGPSSVK